MARGEFSLLSNPLILGLLATKAVSNLAEADRVATQNRLLAEQAGAERLATMAKATGQTVSTIPKTGIPGLFAKIGLGAEYTPVTPYQQAAQSLALQEKQQSETKEEEAAIGALSKLGPEARKAMVEGPFAKLFTGEHALPPEVAKPRPAEIKAMEGTPVIVHAIKPTGEPNYSIPERLVSKRPGESAPAGTAFGPAPKPPMSEEEYVRRAGEAAGERTRAIREATENMPAYQYDKGGNRYYIPLTNAIPRRVTPKDGSIKQVQLGGGFLANPKAQDSFNRLGEVTRTLDEIDALGQAKLVHTKGMDPNTAAAEVLKRGLSLQWSAGRIPFTHGLIKIPISDEEANRLLNMGSLADIQTGYLLQNRYASTTEIKSLDDLVKAPITQMSAEQFHDRIQAMKRTLLSGVTIGAQGEEEGIRTDDANSIVDDAEKE